MTQLERELLSALKGLRQAVMDAHLLNVRKYPHLCIADSEASRMIYVAEKRENELLECLKAVVAISDRKHEAWDRAHEAIRKAEGR